MFKLAVFEDRAPPFFRMRPSISAFVVETPPAEEKVMRRSVEGTAGFVSVEMPPGWYSRNLKKGSTSLAKRLCLGAIATT